MSSTLDVHILSIPLPDTANDWQGDTKIANLFRAPTAANGGGITILEAYFTNQAADGAGTASKLFLYNYGTPGTAVSGTIGSAGGTADPWAAGVPKAFTLTAAQQLIDAGEWVVLSKDEENSSDFTRGILTIHYIMGN